MSGLSKTRTKERKEASFVQPARRILVHINKQLNQLAEQGEDLLKKPKKPSLATALANFNFIQTLISADWSNLSGELEIVLDKQEWRDHLNNPTAVLLKGNSLFLVNYWGLGTLERRMRIKKPDDLALLWKQNKNHWTIRPILKLGKLSRWEIAQTISKTIEPLAADNPFRTR